MLQKVSSFGEKGFFSGRRTAFCVTEGYIREQSVSGPAHKDSFDALQLDTPALDVCTGLVHWLWGELSQVSPLPTRTRPEEWKSAELTTVNENSSSPCSKHPSRAGSIAMCGACYQHYCVRAILAVFSFWRLWNVIRTGKCFGFTFSSAAVLGGNTVDVRVIWNQDKSLQNFRLLQMYLSRGKTKENAQMYLSVEEIVANRLLHHTALHVQVTRTNWFELLFDLGCYVTACIYGCVFRRLVDYFRINDS